MIHKEILETIKKDKKKGDFIYPYYGKYSIAEIPKTILCLFGYSNSSDILPIKYGNKDFDKIIFVLADAFGFDLFLKVYKKYKLLSDFAKKGDVLPITSIFPSTTSAAASLFHSGLTSEEHGLPEFYLYLKELGQIVETLPFRSIGSSEKDEMLKKGGKPEMLFDGETIYEKLNSIGVKSFVFTFQDYAKSTYSLATQKGAESIGFSDGVDLAKKLKDKLENFTGKAYYMIYFDEIDSAGHKHGLNTPEHTQALANLFDSLENEFIRKVNSGKIQKSLFLLSSDHGQIAVDPKETIYLNNYPEITCNLTVAPTGHSRDVFLEIKKDKIDETIELLKKILGDKAEIIKMTDAVKSGLFGMGIPSQKFLDRVGNVLILPKKNKIWYRHISTKKAESVASHGCLSEQEMIVPFAYAKLTDLI